MGLVEMSRERVTYEIETRRATNRSRSATRRVRALRPGPSCVRPGTHDISTRPYPESQRLRAATHPAAPVTRRTSRATNRSSFDRRRTPSETHRTASATHRPRLTTRRAPSPTRGTWHRRSDLRADTTRPPRCITVASAVSAGTSPATSLARATRRLSPLGTTRLHRATLCHPLHRHRTRPVTHRSSRAIVVTSAFTLDPDPLLVGKRLNDPHIETFTGSPESFRALRSRPRVRCNSKKVRAKNHSQANYDR